jgi:hypothetical protein
MQILDFPELAELLNHSRTTHISLEPIETKENVWAIYRAQHKVHTSTYPFRILYLNSKASSEDLESVARAHSRRDTHVVYPPSLSQRQVIHHKLFDDAAGLWTTKEYLASFIKDELETYLSKLPAKSPEYYIDPRIETPSGFIRKRPNPVLSLLVDRDLGATVVEGALGILLAEPGQGKTYMSLYLVSQLPKYADGLVPLIVDSTQWNDMAVSDQRSLWKTIVHSFRHFGAPIPWLDGHEDQFLRAALKADIFRIIFDGFDEYILRNGGSVQPFEVLEALSELAVHTGARIVITSRTSFWNTNLPQTGVESFLVQTQSLLYRILPFDLEHAKNYFTNRFTNQQKKIDQAVHIFNMLRRGSGEFFGRGFVLKLIAEVVENAAGDYPPNQVADIDWLLKALCEREIVRQRLPLSASEQLDFMRLFGTEVAMGQEPITKLVEFTIELVRADLDADARGDCMDKLKDHPLIGRDPVTDHWFFREKQVEMLLIASFIATCGPDSLQRFMANAKLSAGEREDLANMIVDVILNSSREAAPENLARLINMTSAVGRVDEEEFAQTEEAHRLAAVIALIAVERYLAQGSTHEERTKFLTQLCGPSTIRGLSFSGTVGRFDFRGVSFLQCNFEQVTWANCKFDVSTTFKRCTFAGGPSPAHTQGLGSVQLQNCILDADASALISALRVNEGMRKYSLDDLRNEIGNVVRKFVIKGGLGLKSVQARHLTKGTISSSPYRDAIVEVLCATVFESHHISGKSEKGFHVRREAEEAVKFWATNNILTGPLREALERLQKKLGLA